MQTHWQVVSQRRDLVVANSSQDLWQQIEDYLRWTDNNPITVNKTITTGKGAGTKVSQEWPRPYSVKALCLHCGLTEEYIRDIRNSKNKQDGYYIALSKAMYIIYIQNLEYATVGVYNPIFTAKVLNMDKEELPTGAIKIEIVNGLPELANSENEILEKIEKENPGLLNPKEQ